MVDEKNAAVGEKLVTPKGPSGPPNTTLGPTPGYAKTEKEDAVKGDAQPPKRGRYTKVTALGTNQRTIKDKIYTNQGTFIVGDWNSGEIQELKKDPGLAVEYFEDGELVIKR